MFEDAGDEDANEECGHSVEHPALAAGGAEGGAGDSPESYEEEADDGQHAGDTAVGSEVDIDVVEVTVPPGAGEGAGDIGGGVAFEVAFDLFGADAEEGVGLDDGGAGAEEGDAVGVGVGIAAGLEDGDDAVLFRLGHDGDGGEGEDGGDDDEDTAEGPGEVDESGKGADPDAAGPAEEDGEGDEEEGGSDTPADGFMEQEVSRGNEEDGHHGAAEGHPVGHEAGDAVGDVGIGEVGAGGFGGGVFLGVLEEAPGGGEGTAEAEGGEDGLGIGRALPGGGEGGDDEEDEEFANLGPGGGGGLGEGGGEEGPGEEEEEEGYAGGVLSAAPLGEGEGDGDAEADLGGGNGDDAEGEGGAGGEDGPIVTFEGFVHSGRGEYDRIGVSFDHPMQIYLLRHGIAEDIRPGKADAERALTSEGVKRLREILKRARAASVAPSVIVTSPYVRARQTAELAAEILGYSDALVPSGRLVPMASPVETWEEVRTLRGEPSVMLVGHEPHMGMMTGYLLGTPELRVDFKKGAMVRVDVMEMGVQPRGVLKWMMAPKLAL